MSFSNFLKQGFFLLITFGLSYSVQAQLNTPDYPAIDNNSQIQGLDFNGNVKGAFIPGHRSTNDGRVALPVIWGTYFFLNVPERLPNIPFVKNPAGTDIMARKNGSINKLSFNDRDIVNRSFSATGSTGQAAICDGTSQFAENSSDPTSPVACGNNDCYRFTVVTSYTENRNQDVYVEIWGRKVEVQVSNPKTANAQLASFRWIGAPQKGLTFTLKNAKGTKSSIFAEPMFTADGRLLVFRIGKNNMTWVNNRTGATITDTYNLVYSVAPANSAACDLTKFQAMVPFSHAPFDNRMKGRYGVADYQFRDPEGKLIADGVDIKGTYPWVDRRGHNFMFETIAENLHNTPKGSPSTQYPTRCADGTTTACDLKPTASEINSNGTVEWKGTKRGVTIAGRWTRGKLVLLDGLVNNTDYALGYEKAAQRQIRLYNAGTGPKGNESGWVNAGVGQHNNFPKDVRERQGMDGNLNLIDTMENLFSYRTSMRSVSSRDVVWLITGGRTTAEVVLDEYIDSSAYIVSEMTGSQSDNGGGIMSFNNGYRASTGLFDGEVRVQNAATTLDFKIPSYGRVLGKARIEPIAMGGVEGRGLFLEPNDAIQYSIPQTVNRPNWVISLFVDPRFNNDSTSRRLITYPDNTTVDLIGRSRIVVKKGGQTVNVSVPGGALKTKAWNHIGFLIENSGRRVSTYIDGYRVSVANPTVSFFLMNGSNLTLGKSGANGIRGWIDEFKVLAHGGNPEYMCNMGRGTLLGLRNSAPAAQINLAKSYPTASHNQISGLLPTGLQHPYYLCFKDYSGNDNAHFANLPAASERIGQQLHFPEGPLVFSKPRPGSTNNAFCLTCHSNSNKTGLDLEALRFNANLSMEHDPRRQPLQPTRLVFGRVPAGFVALGPSSNRTAPLDGLLLDEFIYSSSGSNGGDDGTSDPPPSDGGGSPPPSSGSGTMGDFVFLDANKNGVFDPAEKGLANVTVRLQDCDAGNATVANTATDGNGNFLFSNVPVGNFRLLYVKPSGYNYTTLRTGSDYRVDSDADPSSGGATACLSMAAGQSRRAIDAGFISSTTVGSTTLGDRVWRDQNGNGIQDNWEQGISGIAVRLVDCNTNSISQRVDTDSDGEYLFKSVTEGRYKIRFAKPANLTFTSLRAGSDNTKDSDVKANGETNCYNVGSDQNRRAIDAGLK
ncbi:MAG: hypothetical protein KDD61_12180 [Bdellovibrionales bacterium]|nr:hypothetical protein [Bdellovibrionales bacterium]